MVDSARGKVDMVIVSMDRWNHAIDSWPTHLVSGKRYIITVIASVV